MLDSDLVVAIHDMGSGLEVVSTYKVNASKFFQKPYDKVTEAEAKYIKELLIYKGYQGNTGYLKPPKIPNRFRRICLAIKWAWKKPQWGVSC